MRRYRTKKQPPKLYFTINQNIEASTLRVIAPTGENLGVMSKSEALKKANEYELDLILVGEKAEPPVAKITDFQKYLFEKRKEQREARKGKKQEVKEFRIGANISEGDLKQRIVRILEFLGSGDKIKLTVPFKGRMITHQRIGREKIDRIYQGIQEKGLGEYEKNPWLEGKNLTAIIKPR